MGPTDAGDQRRSLRTADHERLAELEFVERAQERARSNGKVRFG